MSYYKVILLILFLLLNSSIIEAKADNGGCNRGWELKIDNEVDGIKICYKTHPTGNVEFKGVVNINTSLNSIVALFSDVASIHEWLYRTEKVSILKEISDHEFYTYTVNTMPFPLKKRDLIVHSVLMQDPETLAVTIKGKSEPGYLKRKKGFIRILAAETFWKFTPKKNGDIEVIFQGYGEAGGSIPASIYRSTIFRWLVKSFLWKLPYSTLKNMKIIIKNEKYQTKTFPYIKELLHQ